MRRSWVKRIVSLIIEGNSFEGIFSLLDVGAGSDFIILEEGRTIGISLGVSVIKHVPLPLRKDLDLMSLAVCSGLKLVCINKIIIMPMHSSVQK